MNNDKLFYYIMMLVILIWLGILVHGVVSELLSKQDSIERCKEAGYDGIKFKSFSNDVECSSFTIEEKIARGIN